jgi:small ligand-binding sensory domain FIST
MPDDRTVGPVPRAILLVTLVLAIAACSADRIVRPDPNVAGSYTLQQVEGTSLPSVVSNDGASSVEITGGSLDLDSDSSWLGRTNFRITTPGGVAHETQVGTGRWSLAGDSLHFTDGGDVAGAVRGDSLWLVRRTNDVSTTYLYTR